METPDAGSSKATSVFETGLESFVPLPHSMIILEGPSLESQPLAEPLLNPGKGLAFGPLRKLLVEFHDGNNENVLVRAFISLRLWQADLARNRKLATNDCRAQRCVKAMDDHGDRLMLIMFGEHESGTFAYGGLYLPNSTKERKGQLFLLANGVV